jgi:hypothetical protein
MLNPLAMNPAQLAAALDKISERIGIANRAFDEYTHGADEWSQDNSAWHLELVFVQLLALTEALGLPVLRGEIASSLVAARKEGLMAAVTDPDGDPHQKWAITARKYWAALHGNYGSEPATTITKDLESLLRDAAYSITDPAVFASPPKDEACVHIRVENLLRCVFPDLVHKPRLGKPIKNFEPDTGIPSIQTLIEYKFLSSAEQIGPIADQLLADTRGYTSRDWNSFVYVIYETKRFRSEAQWRQLLRQCGVESSAGIVVMSGHPVARKPANRRQPNQ